MAVGAGGPGGGWRLTSASVTGTRHAADDEACEDALALCSVPDREGGEPMVVVAVADGAGGAARGGDGARLAVTAVAAGLGAALGTAPDTSRDWSEVLTGCLGQARDVLVAAATCPASVGELATTLIVVVLAPAVIAAAQVGDGAIVVSRGEGDLDLVAGAPGTEYLNETTFITSSRWLDALRVEVRPRHGVTGIAVMTDGLSLLALDLASGEPYPGFFVPLLSFAASDASDAAQRQAELAAFLSSERVCSRTDD